MTVSAKVDYFMTETRETFMSVSGTVGLICAALPPALMFGFAAFHALETSIGFYGALAVAISLGVALEAVGVKVSHTALESFALYRGGDTESKTAFYWLAGLTVLYLGIGIAAILFFDEKDIIRITGILAYAVAGIMYVASGFEMIQKQRKQGIISQLQEAVNTLQANASDLQTRASQWQADANQAQADNKQLQSEAREAQAAATAWEDRANESTAAAKEAEMRAKRYQNEAERLQEIEAAWQQLSSEQQALLRYGANIIDAEQAGIIIGVKDKRTVASRLQRLQESLSVFA